MYHDSRPALPKKLEDKNGENMLKKNGSFNLVCALLLPDIGLREKKLLDIQLQK